jgi:hypothetical protein
MRSEVDKDSTASEQVICPKARLPTGQRCSKHRPAFMFDASPLGSFVKLLPIYGRPLGALIFSLELPTDDGTLCCFLSCLF